MYTPLSLGGFGMVDLNALGDSLDLRSYGRLQVTKHPFMSQLRDRIISTNFFNLRFDLHVDSKALKGLKLVNEARKGLLRWNSESVIRDLNFRKALTCHLLKELLSAQGRGSLTYLAIHNRIPRIKIGELTLQEF